MDQAKNFAKGTVSTGYDDVATSIVLNTGDGAKFPAAPFNAVWWNSTDYPDPADDPDKEIIRVTAIATDTLTVTRGQEGTGAQAKELEGKVYKLIAPLTAKVINEEMLPVSLAGNDYAVTTPDALQFNVGGSCVFSVSGANYRLAAASMVLELAGGIAALGDVDENDTGVALLVDNNLGQNNLRGKIGTNQKVSASVAPTNVNGKIEVFDLAGNSIGFLALYSSIT